MRYKLHNTPNVTALEVSGTRQFSDKPLRLVCLTVRQSVNSCQITVNSMPGIVAQKISTIKILNRHIEIDNTSYP